MATFLRISVIWDAGRQYMDKEVQRLYSTVSDTNYNHLEKGLNIANFKSEFPKKFETSHAVNSKSLLERTNHQADSDELTHIIKKILELA